ncbi:MAG: phage tail protein [Symbiobacteriaceae bacterium]|jgi:microcystin-dependent protein|nr:phage tail protein [Symbiobacteriaceae bacterium]
MSDMYIGEIRMFAGTFAPMGWALCNGQLLSISEYEALFSLIGTTYGGDGQTNFAVPDLRSRIPVHMGQNPSTGTTYNLGAAGGVETVTVTTNQMPAHTHTAYAQSEPGSNSEPSGAVWASSTIKQFTATAPNAAMNAGLLSPVGGNQPHDNMMPFLAVNFIIALEGEYPPQN